MNKYVCLLFMVTYVVLKYALNNLDTEYDNALTVSFLNIGQGDSSIIGSNHEGYIMIDGGPDKTIDFTIPRTSMFDFCNISEIFLSHIHDDHVKGITSLLARCSNSYTFNDIFLYVSDPVMYRQYFESNLYINWSRVHLKQIYEGLTLCKVFSNHKRIDIYVLWPPKDLSNKITDENDKSLVILIDSGDFEILYTGDVSSSVLEKLKSSRFLSLIDNGLDVYKVPHHGSPGSTNLKLLKMLKPIHCVISVGKNSYGHPSDKMLQELDSVGCIVHRTDVEGIIEFKF